MHSLPKKKRLYLRKANRSTFFQSIGIWVCSIFNCIQVGITLTPAMLLIANVVQLVTNCVQISFHRVQDIFELFFRALLWQQAQLRWHTEEQTYFLPFGTSNKSLFFIYCSFYLRMKNYPHFQFEKNPSILKSTFLPFPT